jgi:hypothetical protein
MVVMVPKKKPMPDLPSERLFYRDIILWREIRFRLSDNNLNMTQLYVKYPLRDREKMLFCDRLLDNMK